MASHSVLWSVLARLLSSYGGEPVEGPLALAEPSLEDSIRLYEVCLAQRRHSSVNKAEARIRIGLLSLWQLATLEHERASG